MKIEVAVFPFHERMLPFIRHFNQAQDVYHICQAIAWSGSGLNGRDAAFICCHPNIGIPVVSPTETKSFIGWQILFVDCDELERSSAAFNSFTFFEQLLSKGKKIIAVAKNNNLCSNGEWTPLCQKYSEQIQFFSAADDVKGKPTSQSSGYSLLSVPVLLVGGLISQEDCLEVILALRESFMCQGKVVSCLTGSNMGLLMDTYTHIFDKKATLSEEDKALVLNQMAQDIVQVERPSLFIVEAPDPMMKYNNAAPNGFGLQTYLLCQALKPNLLVCSVPPDVAVAEGFLSLISKDFTARYGVPIMALHVNNVMVAAFDIIRLHKVTCVHTNIPVADMLRKQQSKNCAFPIFNVVSEGADGLAQLILQREALLW